MAWLPRPLLVYRVTVLRTPSRVDGESCAASPSGCAPWRRSCGTGAAPLARFLMSHLEQAVWFVQAYGSGRTSSLSPHAVASFSHPLELPRNLKTLRINGRSCPSRAHVRADRTTRTTWFYPEESPSEGVGRRCAASAGGRRSRYAHGCFRRSRSTSRDEADGTRERSCIACADFGSRDVVRCACLRTRGSQPRSRGTVERLRARSRPRQLDPVCGVATPTRRRRPARPVAGPDAVPDRARQFQPARRTRRGGLTRVRRRRLLRRASRLRCNRLLDRARGGAHSWRSARPLDGCQRHTVPVRAWLYQRHEVAGHDELPGGMRRMPEDTLMVEPQDDVPRRSHRHCRQRKYPGHSRASRARFKVQISFTSFAALDIHLSITCCNPKCEIP